MLEKPDHFHYAREQIKCDCKSCQCPAQGGKYSFVRVNEKLKIIFYSIPKSATSTIRMVFFDNDFRYSMITPVNRVEDYLSFTIVRNPWSRLVSCWRMFTKQPFRIRQMESMYEGKIRGFSHFAELTTRIDNHHWQPQDLFVPETVKFIGKVEHLEQDIKALCDKIGMDVPELPHLNRTSHRPYREYYDDSTRELVAERYRRDIERFEYSFDDGK